VYFRVRVFCCVAFVCVWGVWCVWVGVVCVLGGGGWRCVVCLWCGCSSLAGGAYPMSFVSFSFFPFIITNANSPYTPTHRPAIATSASGGSPQVSSRLQVASDPDSYIQRVQRCAPLVVGFVCGGVGVMCVSFVPCTPDGNGVDLMALIPNPHRHTHTHTHTKSNPSLPPPLSHTHILIHPYTHIKPLPSPSHTHTGRPPARPRRPSLQGRSGSEQSWRRVPSTRTCRCVLCVCVCVSVCEGGDGLGLGVSSLSRCVLFVICTPPASCVGPSHGPSIHPSIHPFPPHKKHPLPYPSVFPSTNPPIHPFKPPPLYIYIIYIYRLCPASSGASPAASSSPASTSASPLSGYVCLYICTCWGGVSLGVCACV
jgi:hypothetical protein